MTSKRSSESEALVPRLSVSASEVRDHHQDPVNEMPHTHELLHAAANTIEALWRQIDQLRRTPW
jgi:hypothetical protein